jgi:L-lactate dehydrogenase complex protein LldF
MPTRARRGANFVVAETGTFAVCANEGNADLSANVAKLQIASIGIEKTFRAWSICWLYLKPGAVAQLTQLPKKHFSGMYRGPRQWTFVSVGRYCV